MEFLKQEDVTDLADDWKVVTLYVSSRWLTGRGDGAGRSFSFRNGVRVNEKVYLSPEEAERHGFRDEREKVGGNWLRPQLFLTKDEKNFYPIDTISIVLEDGRSLQDFSPTFR